MGSPRMGAHRSMVIDGGEQIKSQARPGPSQIWMYCTMYDSIPFSCKTERVNERASGSACVCTGGIVTGYVPRRAALGLCCVFSGTRCTHFAGCLQRSLSFLRTRLVVKRSSLVVSSLLPGPWVWGERDSTVGSTVTIRMRLR